MQAGKLAVVRKKLSASLSCRDSSCPCGGAVGSWLHLYKKAGHFPSGCRGSPGLYKTPWQTRDSLRLQLEDACWESSCRGRGWHCSRKELVTSLNIALTSTKESTKEQQSVKSLETSWKWLKDPWGMIEEGLELGSSREKWGHLMPPFVTGKETQHHLHQPCREGMSQAVLALCWLRTSAGAAHGTQQPYRWCPFTRCCCLPSTHSSWLRDHYRLISKQRVQLHWKVHPLSPGRCQALVELGSVGLLPPGSSTVAGTQQLLHPLLLPNLQSIQPWLYAVLCCNVGSSKSFLPCGVCFSRLAPKIKIKSL